MGIYKTTVLPTGPEVHMGGAWFIVVCMIIQVKAIYKSAHPRLEEALLS